ncbi:MAG: flagellar export chaperone FlgN [Candidatus Acidiferrum sp.]|jgi:DNA repair ATPase RecN
MDLNSDAHRYLELLDRRIETLGSLAEALLMARQHMICLDIDGLEARIAQQENLCRKVRAMDRQLDQLQEQCASKVGLLGTESAAHGVQEFAGRLELGRQRMKSAQERVKALNESHRALLRRCRRTTNALLNSYAVFAGTYADPRRAGGTLNRS